MIGTYTMLKFCVFVQVEVEATNTQMLLGCLMLTVQDTAALEEAELRQNDG